MFPLEYLLGSALFVSLLLYALGGGADFGGGVWDLFASGKTRAGQRELISRAIGPIWEANHVWLILVVVILFVGFPKAFAVATTALHIPLTVMLLGIVFRGSAFTFRTYDVQQASKKWSLMFAIASIITPVMLGICVGALVSGKIRINPATQRFVGDFFSSWLGAFPLAVGLFALVLFAHLAAVYLSNESRSEEVQRAFRSRSLVSGVLLGAVAFLCLFLSREGAPVLYATLVKTPGAILFQVITAFFGLATLHALWKWRFNRARLLVILQTCSIFIGWGWSQFPYLVLPDLTFSNCAAPTNVIALLLGALCVGGLVLFPALIYLYRIFKEEKAPGVKVPAGNSGRDI
jgi:cytochrome d ubiquinol oxidase subunit II